MTGPDDTGVVVVPSSLAVEVPPARGVQRLLRLGGAALRLAAIAALAGTSGLVLWAIMPLAVGLTAHVLVSGSMVPSVRPGDVLLSERVDPHRLKPGMIVVFPQPDEPGRVLAHRLRTVGTGGELTTQGDANPTADTFHVRADDVLGVARVRVPFVGLPALWLAEGAIMPLVLAFVVVAATAAIAFRRPTSPPEP